MPDQSGRLEEIAGWIESQVAVGSAHPYAQTLRRLAAGKGLVGDGGQGEAGQELERLREALGKAERAGQNWLRRYEKLLAAIDRCKNTTVREKLLRDHAELRRALEPFAEWAKGIDAPPAVEAHPDHPGDGQWSEFGVGKSKDRIVDWFGPSDFFNALAVFGLTASLSASSDTGGAGEPDQERGR